jgi:hypothetical protein
MKSPSFIDEGSAEGQRGRANPCRCGRVPSVLVRLFEGAGGASRNTESRAPNSANHIEPAESPEGRPMEMPYIWHESSPQQELGVTPALAGLAEGGYSLQP